MRTDDLIKEAEFIKDHSDKVLKPPVERDTLIVLNANTWRGRWQLTCKFFKAAFTALFFGSATMMVKRRR